MMTRDAGSDESPGEVPEAVRERIEADQYCATLGIEVVDLDSGRAATRLTVTEDLLNFHGTPHGGAVYSLADAAFAADREASTGTPATEILREKREADRRERDDRSTEE